MLPFRTCKSGTIQGHILNSNSSIVSWLNSRQSVERGRQVSPGFQILDRLYNLSRFSPYIRDGHHESVQPNHQTLPGGIHSLVSCRMRYIHHKRYTLPVPFPSTRSFIETMGSRSLWSSDPPYDLVFDWNEWQSVDWVQTSSRILSIPGDSKYGRRNIDSAVSSVVSRGVS
jgi:hypothetical protein